MSNKFNHLEKAKLKSEKRRKLLPPAEILAKLELSQTKVFLDYGCGTGYFTLPAAQMLSPFAGQVIAADIEPLMLEELQEEITAQNINNIQLVLAEETRIPLASNIADLILLGFVLHEADSPEIMIKEAGRLLKKGGRLAVLEWQKKKGEMGPPIDHRISEEQVASLVKDDSFSAIESIAVNSECYLMMAVK